MKFYGELLIFLLLLIISLRVFFVSHVRRDPLAALVPVVFVLSILQIIAWGIDAFTVFSFVLSFLVFISNFHAMFRYTEQLYIDHYSIVMKCWAAVTFILSALAIAAALFFAPIEIKSEKLMVNEKTVRYKGNFRTDFEPASIFNFSDAVFYEYSPAAALGEEKPEPKEIVLFIPDKRADSFNYKPYLQLLAKEGYLVCSADFFANDLKWMHSFEDMRSVRRIASVIHSYTDNQNYMSQREFYTYNISLECNALLKILDERYGPDTSFYMISDVMGNTAIKDFSKKYNQRVKGIFFLDSISEYKTPGYGCVEQTDPLLARFLGLTGDHSMKTPKLLTAKTKEFLENTNDLTGTK